MGAVFARRYAVRGRLGSGASATVYRAFDQETNVEVALKISRPFLLTKNRRAARFLREVQAVERVEHPGCVKLLDWGVEADSAYLAMELIDGEDLFDLIQREAPLHDSRALEIAANICDVLASAHALGVIHRDLKPRNVMIVADDQVKLLDFGLAKLMRTPADEEGTLPQDLTRPGSVLGTPHYMAPEQVGSGKEVDGRSDLYSVAVILYEMLTARRPLEERNAVRALIAIGTKAPVPPSEYVADIDGDVERAVLRGLSKAREDRFQTAEDMAADLRDLAEQADEDGASTRLFRSTKSATEELESREDEMMTRVQRVRPSVDDDGDPPEVPTRVYEVVSQRAPRMVAKTTAFPTSVTGNKARTVARTKKLPSAMDLDGESQLPPHDEDYMPTKVMRSKSSMSSLDVAPTSSQPSRGPHSDAGASSHGPHSSQPHSSQPHSSHAAPGGRGKRSRGRPLASQSELEKGIRAALVTITIAALGAALGRWLELW